MLLSAVDDHRAQIHGVTTLAEADIAGYASSILNEPSANVAAQLRVAAPAVISTYGEVAAVSGALFYETNRPKPGFTADLVGASIGEQLTAELGWALTPLFVPEQFDLGPAEAVNRLSGVVQKFVATADRETIRSAAKRDHLSTGVTRYATAGGCAFCALMSAQSARGGHWHNNCRCVEAPSWQDAPAPASEVRDQHSEAAYGAIAYLDKLKTENPDWTRMKSRQFFRKYPELAMNNKNLTRVMRELYGFAH